VVEGTFGVEVFWRVILRWCADARLCRFAGLTFIGTLMRFECDFVGVDVGVGVRKSVPHPLALATPSLAAKATFAMLQLKKQSHIPLALSPRTTCHARDHVSCHGSRVMPWTTCYARDYVLCQGPLDSSGARHDGVGRGMMAEGGA
jgi:hypothetical protein